MATWYEFGDNSLLTYATINLTNGIVSANRITPKLLSAYLYSTHDKLYSVFCLLKSKKHSYDLDTYFSVGNGSLIYLSSYNFDSLSFVDKYYFVDEVLPYGPYLVVFFDNSSTCYVGNNSYEIWDLETRTLVKERTTYLAKSSCSNVKVATRDRGIYVLSYDFTGSWSGNDYIYTLHWIDITVGKLIDGYPHSNQRHGN